MKKLLLIALMVVGSVTMASAQAEIKFDKVTVNFGTFPETNPVQHTTFTFTNVGNQPLLLKQVVAACGCTVPKYDKRPIAPGQRGSIEVTYNGKNKIPSHFKKAITVYSNGKVEMTRLYIEGDMTAK